MKATLRVTSGSTVFHFVEGKGLTIYDKSTVNKAKPQSIEKGMVAVIEGQIVNVFDWFAKEAVDRGINPKNQGLTHRTNKNQFVWGTADKLGRAYLTRIDHTKGKVARLLKDSNFTYQVAAKILKANAA